MEPPRAAMERCSCASRWAAVGAAGAPSGPRTCPLPGMAPEPAEGNACSSAGRTSGPWAIARGHDDVADSDADAARWATISTCGLCGFSLDDAGSAELPCSSVCAPSFTLTAPCATQLLITHAQAPLDTR